MHIAFNGWFWEQPNVGSGQYVRSLLHNLRRVAPDLQMTLILPHGQREIEDLPHDVSIVLTDGRAGKLGKVLFEQRTFPQMVERVGADIAHVPYWGPPLKSPAKLITSILDVIPLMLPEYAAGFTARLYTSLVTAAARGSAHVITLSEDSKGDIVEKLGITQDRVSAIHLACADVFHPRMGADGDNAVRQKYDLPDEFVLYLGGFDRRKQLNQLLLAYTYVADGQDVPLVIAGREPQWGSSMFPDMRQYAADLKIDDYIQWIGYVDEADKPALYRLATAFAYPSRYEGFGLPLLEAMASGTPAVANELPVFEEIVGDAAYLVEPGNARAMGGALLALINQRPFRETMANQGLARATHFSWRKTAQQTLAVYEQVLGG